MGNGDRNGSSGSGRGRGGPAGRSRALGWTGFGLVFLVLGLPALPFFWHESWSPDIGPYASSYAVFLAVITGCVAIGAALVGRACSRRGTLRPALLVVLSGVSLAVLVVAVEIVLGFAAPDPFSEYRGWGQRRAILFGFENEPNRQWSRVGASYSTDEFGFRTHVTDPAWHGGPVGDGVRIFAIGGSSVFGFGLQDDEAWPHLLQSELGARRPDSDILVVNAGNNGHDSLMTFLRLYLRVLSHRPTHVVLYQARNDVRATRVASDDEQFSEQILFSTTYKDYLQKVFEGRTYYFRTHVGDLVIRAWKRTRGTGGPPRNGSGGAAFEEPASLEDEHGVFAHNGAAYLASVQAIADLCRRQRIRLILTTFAYDAGIRPAWNGRGIRYFNDLVHEFAEAEGIPLIDLAAQVEAEADRERLFFQDSYHPSREGARYIAQRLATEIAPLLDE